MCGIFAYSGKKKANLSQFFVDRLYELEYRGYDSSGMAIAGGDGNFAIIKQTGKILNLDKTLGKKKISGNLGLVHTRWATHGGITTENAHPHKDCSGEVVLAHNGIVENHESLREALKKKGHKFISETDTETIPHLIEEYQKNPKTDFKKAVIKTFRKLHGTNAIVVISKKGELVAIRNGSPLVLGKNKKDYLLSSDLPTLKPLADEILILENQQGICINKEGLLQYFDIKTDKSLKPKFKRAAADAIVVDQGKYAHFMLKEIYEQPQAIKNIINLDKKIILKAAEEIDRAYGTFFTACGTAAYSGLAATYWFSQVAGKHVNYQVASEFAYFEDFLTNKTLLIAASQSGETMDTMEAVRAAKKHKTKILSIVNVSDSSLDRASDMSIHLNAGVEKAVVSTKAFMAKLSLFLLLSYTCSGKYQRGIKLLRKTAAELDKFLASTEIKKIQKISKKLAKAEHIYLIGRGVNYPIALEGALKLKEAAYVHAEAFAAGELKHGVIALIEKGTPCICLFAYDRAEQEMLSNTAEIKARGANVIGIGYRDNDAFDDFIKVADLGSASAMVNVLVLQLLAYHIAINKKLDPDMPRNLAKAVTVK